MAKEDNKNEEAPPKDRSKLFGLIFIVVNLLVSIGGAALVYMNTVGYKSPTVNEYTENEKLEEMRKYMESNPIVYTMDTFTINLKGATRTIRMSLSLEMLSEEGFEEVISKNEMARDEIVKIINSKKFDEIESIQGKLFLKDQIASSINSILEKGVIKDVYFGDFVVQ